MLILPQLVEVKIASRNNKHYVNLGYDVKNGDIITTDVEKLSKGSHVKVKCLCDICGCSIERAYKDYLYNHDYENNMDCCNNCKIVKFKNTSLKRYGTDSPMRCDEVKENLKKSLEENYGTYKISSLPEIREKIKHSCLEKYGVENSLQLPKTREKMKEYYDAHKDEIIEKRMNTLSKNGEIHTSSQQIAVYKMLKERYKNVELNYVFGKFSLDVALFVYDKKIDIEYDGWYWHQDKQRDRRRDEVLKSQGWSVLRIRSGNKIPTIEQLVEKIDYIINNNIKYSEIVLVDWKEAV